MKNEQGTKYKLDITSFPFKKTLQDYVRIPVYNIQGLMNARDTHKSSIDTTPHTHQMQKEMQARADMLQLARYPSYKTLPVRVTEALLGC